MDIQYTFLDKVEELTEELRQIREGEVIVMPVSQEHADAMVKVGMTYGKTFSDGEWK